MRSQVSWRFSFYELPQQVASVFALLFLVATLSSARADPAAPPGAGAPASVVVDPALPHYVKPAAPLKGRLLIGGSGTMGRFIKPLAEQFVQLHPNVTQEITLRGSGYAPDGLAKQEYNIGVMSRPMDPREKAGLKADTHKDVIGVVVASDAILVLVNEKNPITGITLPQLDALFGTKRLAGYQKPVATWGDLGVAGELKESPIEPFGILEEHNGTVETFRRLALLGGPLNTHVGNIKYPESEFGQTVAANAAGISYNVDYEPVKGAKPVNIAAKDGAPFVAASVQNVSDGSYPLTRRLHAYLVDTNDHVAVEFLRFTLSQEGQRVVAAQSAAPLPAAYASQQRKLLEK